MLFNSIDFLIFFPIITIFYFLIPKKFRNVFLVFSSLYFYMSWKTYYVVLILFTIAITYICGRLIENLKQNDGNKVLLNLIFAGSILSNLGVLFIFKYFNFFVANINALTGMSIGFLSFALPVGISFYTFQAIGYVVDVYSNKINAEKNIINYTLFISFYPQLVAGPIERSNNLLKQIKSQKTFNYENMRKGLLTMAYGFFLKLVIADRLALFVNNVYKDYLHVDGSYLFLATLLFAIQIYCDFASYSYIAIGAARVMGFKLMTNFKAPYLSKNISEYWSRWHISLSTWFEDYIFKPIVWSSKNPQKAIYLGVIAVFLISGIWHGASWTFILWGLIHAVFRVFGILLKTPKKKLYKKLKINTKSKLLQLLQVLCTFLLICFTYIFFRAESVSKAFEIINIIISNFNITTLFSSAFFEFGIDIHDFVVAVISLIILFVCDLIIYNSIDIYSFIVKKNRCVRWLIYWTIILVIIIFGVYGPNYDAAPFIYFQF